MYVPGARERVFRKGMSGLYLVMSVDFDRQLAEIVSLDAEPELVEDIPFSELEPFDRGLIETK